MFLVRLLVQGGMLGTLRIVGRLLLDGRVPLGLKLIPLAAIVYLLSPIDLIPDFLGIRGRLDDLVALLLAPLLFLGLAPRKVVAEQAERVNERRQSRKQRHKRVIEGSYRRIDGDQ